MKTYKITLHPDRLAVLNDGEISMGTITRQARETLFNEWIKVGRGIVMWREIAMEEAQTEDINAHAYRKAFAAIGDQFPLLAKLNKTERSHAAWLWENHQAIEQWHSALPSDQARRLNYPSAIWKKNPLAEFREKKVSRVKKAATDIIEVTSDLKDVVGLITDAASVSPAVDRMDLSTPEMIKASGELIRDYHGPERTGKLVSATASTIGFLVAPPGIEPQILAQQTFDWLPAEHRQDFATSFARLLSATPAAKPTRSRKKPAA